jgi:acetylornithine deacetylase/succinyl-diaminopimelate desuccinylase-like protein
MQNEFIKLFYRLIRNYAETGNTKAVNKSEEIMKNFLEKRGIHCVMEQLGKRKILYASTLPGKNQKILFNSHLDIVPVTDMSQCEPVLKAGKLYGRGTGDCIGNSVCIAALLCRFKGKAEIGAIFSSDEECGGLTTKEMIRLGYGAKQVIIIIDGEDWARISYAQKGILVLKLTARGKGGHASKPWYTDNPIDKLVRGYGNLLYNWENPKFEEDWRASMAAVIISGGHINNQVSEKAELTLNFRFTKDEDRDEIIKFVKETTHLEVAEIECCYPCHTDPENSKIQLLYQAYRETLPSEDIKFGRICGATDARFLKTLDKPIAILASDSKGFHSNEEYVRLSSLDDMLEVLTNYLRKVEQNDKS